MKKQEMLHVEWNDKESATYYIDKDMYSKAARITPNQINLSTFEGVYIFDEASGEITLHTGTELRAVPVKTWKAYFTPTP